MASPVLDFVSLLASQVSATYANFPSGSRVVVMNQTSGEVMPKPVTELKDSSGKLGIVLPEGFPSGAFYLKGLDGSGGSLAQSVVFYFAGN